MLVTLRGNRKVRAKIWLEGERVCISFPFDAKLKDDIKAMEGAKWHGFDKSNPRKIWSVKKCKANEFQLNYLMGKNPFAIYDGPYPPYTPTRNLYAHQIKMVEQGLATHYCIWAAEMGTGKTLAAIELIEATGSKDIFWIGPRSALNAVMLEFRKWQCQVRPTFYTYAKLRNVIKDWRDRKAPQVVIFDESSRVKSPTALRSQAAMQLADGVREDWDKNGYVILMSGTPAPKSPVDWWHQCHVACPGFLREGNIHKFRRRLSIIEDRENPITGGVYPHHITWLDDEKKCSICGRYEIEHSNSDHRFTKSKNEVEALYRRMKGLVQVFFKKDCLDLPDKLYRIIECEPSDETKRIASLLVKTAPRTITALERLRELSDGFQYKEKEIGTTTCPNCKGSGKCVAPVYDKPENTAEDIPDEVGLDEVICDKCGGNGEIPKVERIVQEFHSPKEDVLVDLLDEYSDVGRVVIYAGFTGSIDKIVKICQSQDWEVLRADGRGWMCYGDGDQEEYLKSFDRSCGSDLLNKYPRVAFVAQSGAAGMGLNLTASPVVIYYSNDFNAESRIQSEDRIHRPGMDPYKGATIIDIVHLDTDRLILDNLKEKRKLQNISLGELRRNHD